MNLSTSHSSTHTPMLTPARIAADLDVSPRTVRRWIDTGQLPAFKCGRTLRVSPDDLQAFIIRHKTTTTQRYAHLAPDHLRAAVDALATPATSCRTSTG